MKTLILLCLVGFQLLASSANAEVTIRNYKATKNAGGHQWNLMQIYFSGFSNGLGYANAELSASGKAPLFCQPGKLKINTENLVDIIDHTIERANPPLADDMFVEGIVLVGMQYTFPCNH
jgi:hypothetical protein